VIVFSADAIKTGGALGSPNGIKQFTDVLPVDMTFSEVNDLFASCFPRLKKASRAMLSNREDAEDALQDGLLLAYRKLHMFEGRSSFLTWLHSIVRNCSRMNYRKAAGRRVDFVGLGSGDDDPNSIENKFLETRPSPEDLCIRNERSDILREFTEELPEKYHDAIRYFHLEGLGEQETAERLHMTRPALKSRLHRSRRILAERIRRSHVSQIPQARSSCSRCSTPKFRQKEKQASR
jgi:RNA polymerase sigma-70 factor (ECF subfamily)